ncbi:hypothetical protein BDZ91DRAFT_731246 [Kalaharituber pfeilii]|nr:hypothetical protein BDZ91DRAFT_731246 [Kalaharituber pfeilii]
MHTGTPRNFIPASTTSRFQKRVTHKRQGRHSPGPLSYPGRTNDRRGTSQPTLCTLTLAFRMILPIQTHTVTMVVPDAVPNPADTEGISADEVALYDRQIRLWGMEAQARMRNSKILLIGMRALANEVAKNLVLAGIGSLTVLDPGNVTEDDLAAQFFVQEEHLGMNRAEAAAVSIQKLNPRVSVYTETSKVQDKDASYFGHFDITIATELDLDTLIHINNACRTTNRPFYAAACYGLHGYVFADLIKHTFVIERDKSNLETILKNETKTRRIVDVRTKREGEKVVEFVTKEETYSPLSEVVHCPIDPRWRPRKRRTVPLALPCIKALWEFQRANSLRRPAWVRTDIAEFTKYATHFTSQLDLPVDMLKASYISSFVEGCNSELAPVAAILGGVLAQDVINVLGKREQPLQNLLIFDGDTNNGPIFALHPEKEDEAAGSASAEGATVDVVSLD